MDATGGPGNKAARSSGLEIHRTKEGICRISGISPVPPSLASPLPREESIAAYGADRKINKVISRSLVPPLGRGREKVLSGTKRAEERNIRRKRHAEIYGHRVAFDGHINSTLY